MRAEFSFVVLAGGRGTRLREVLPDTPKVLADVAGKPIVRFLLQHAVTFGPRRLVACLGDQSGEVREALGHEIEGVPVHCTIEKELLGTGGAIRLGLLETATPWSMVANGDSFCDGPWQDWITRYQQEIYPRAGIVVTHLDDTSRYGRVEWDQRTGRVHSFVEKGQGAGSGWINAGVYFLPSELAHQIEGGRVVSFEREILPLLCHQNLTAIPAPGPFLDIGTPKSYAERIEFFGKLASRMGQA